MKPDVICVWPKDVLYPAFTKRINKDRKLFNKVIIVISDGVLDKSQDINIQDATILIPNLQELTAGGKDWRNVCVNLALEKSDSDYVLFLEQDFIAGDGFFEKLLKSIEGFGTLGFKDGNRLHPSCLLVEREILNKTSKDFSAYPPEDDHFARVTKELMALDNWKILDTELSANCYHLASLTFNIRLEKEGKPVQYRPDEYKLYKLLVQLM